MPLSSALLARPEHDHIVLPAGVTIGQAFEALLNAGGDLGYHFVMATPGGKYQAAVAGSVAAYVFKDVKVAGPDWLNLLAYGSNVDLMQLFKGAAWRVGDSRFAGRLADLPLPIIPAVDKGAMSDDQVMAWLDEQGHLLAAVLSDGQIVGLVRAHHLL
jgi:hypothetical protein